MASEDRDKDRVAGTWETREKVGPCLPILHAAFSGGQKC